jgi:hypothetical protein
VGLSLVQVGGRHQGFAQLAALDAARERNTLKALEAAEAEADRRMDELANEIASSVARRARWPQMSSLSRAACSVRASVVMPTCRLMRRVLDWLEPAG